MVQENKASNISDCCVGFATITEISKKPKQTVSYYLLLLFNINFTRQIQLYKTMCIRNIQHILFYYKFQFIVFVHHSYICQQVDKRSPFMVSNRPPCDFVLAFPGSLFYFHWEWRVLYK